MGYLSIFSCYLTSGVSIFNHAESGVPLESGRDEFNDLVRDRGSSVGTGSAAEVRQPSGIALSIAVVTFRFRTSTVGTRCTAPFGATCWAVEPLDESDKASLRPCGWFRPTARR